MEIIKADSHRNGVAGEPFKVAIIHDGDSKKLVIMFEEQYTTAVFDLDLLKEEIIEMGENSWRGDQYDNALRDELTNFVRKQSEDRFKASLASLAARNAS